MLKKFLFCTVIICSVLFITDTYSQVKTSFVPDLGGKTQANVSASKVATTNEGSVLQSKPEDYPTFTGFPLPSIYQIYIPKTGSIACNMDSDSDLEIVYGCGPNLYVVKKDGTSVPGWPIKYADNWINQWSTAYGDIDGDGEGELVLVNGAALGGKLIAYKKNGTVVPGFPISTIGKNVMAPILADLDNDGKMEIILAIRNGQAFVYKGDGTVYPGWPKWMDRYPASNLACGDINNDGAKEIIGESKYCIYVWDKNGNVLPGFPYGIDSLYSSTSYSAPVLADLDKNGKKQIIFCSHSDSTNVNATIYVVNPDGTNYPGWPKKNFGKNWVYAPVTVADIDGDGYLDIVVPEYGSTTDPESYIFGFKRDGTPLSGFPKGPYFGMANQITVADIDNDGKYELIADQNVQFSDDSGEYIAVKLDGTSLANWPLKVALNTSFQQPILTDLNGDGNLDIVGSSFEYTATNRTNLYAWNTGLKYNASKIINPTYQFNLQHDGNYVTPTTVPVELSSFNASYSNGSVLVKWATATETNNSFFELFRNDVKVTSINGKGTTSEKSYYSFTDKNVSAGQYTYKLVQHDLDGTKKTVGEVKVSASNGPASFSLKQNFPNPFNPSTSITYNLSSDSKVKLTVYNVIGQSVKELVNRNETAGTHQVVFDASNLPSGVYTYSIAVVSNDGASLFSQSKKMILMK